MLPEGWKKIQIKDCGTVVTGSTPDTRELKYYGDDFVFVSPKDMDVNKEVFTSEKKLSLSGYSQCRKVRKGATLCTCIGSTIGKIAFAGVDLVTNQQINSVIPNNYFDDDYIYYALKNISDDIKNRAGTQAIPIINKSEFSRLYIIAPKLEEQKKIGSIISTWDKAISTMDALLANSRQQKKALMQQLLTGKRRLPGFTGEWKNCQFRNIFSILSNTPLSRAEVEDGGEVEYVHYGDIHKISASYLDVARDYQGKISSNKVKSDFLEDGDLLVADASEDFEGIGKAVEVKNIQDKKAIAGLHIILARPDKTLLAKGYAGKIQFIPSVKKQFISLATGISVFGLSKTNFLSVSVLLPPLDEQRAIAAVLDAADREIVLLEQKAARLREEKKSLMQQLLTGKRRVRL